VWFAVVGKRTGQGTSQGVGGAAHDGEAAGTYGGPRAVGQRKLTDDGERGVEMTIRGQARDDSPRPLGRPRWTDVARFENHVIDAERLVVPGAHEP